MLGSSIQTAQIPSATGTPDYVVGVGLGGYYVKSGSTGQVVTTSATFNGAVTSAIGDGSSLSMIFIQVTSGAFTATDNILVPTNKPFHLKGAGVGITSVSWTQGAGGVHFIRGNGNTTDVTIEDLTITDVTAGTTASGGIVTFATNTYTHNNWLVKNVECINCDIELNFVTTGYAKVINCYVHDITRYTATGIRGSYNLNYEAYGNTVTTVYDMGMSGGDNTNSDIHDNNISYTAQGISAFAIDVANDTNPNVHHNIITNCASGIQSENSAGDILFQNNILTGTATNTGYGIRVYRIATGDPQAASVSILSNTIKTFQYPIQVKNQNIISIKKNTLRNCGRSLDVEINGSWGLQPTIADVISNSLYDCGREANQGAVLCNITTANIRYNTIIGTNIASTVGINYCKPNSVFIGNTISGYPSLWGNVTGLPTRLDNIGYIAPGEVRTYSGSLVPTGTCTATTVSGTFTESPLALKPGANTMTCTASGTINVVMPAGSTAVVTSGDSTVTDSPKTCPAGATTLVTVTTGAGADTFTITVHSNAFAWHNPEAQDILVKKVVINRTAAGGTATAEINVGIADNGTVDDPGTEFFENLLANNAAAIHDSYVAGGTSYGTQTIWVNCQDSASATGGWIVGKIDTEIANSLAGTYYIEVVGK